MLGGAKVSGKLGVIKNLQMKVDKVIIGGGMAFTFFKALGLEVGNSLVEADHAPGRARDAREPRAPTASNSISPSIASWPPAWNRGPKPRSCPYRRFPRGWTGLDIGPASVRLFTEALANAKTILWNGPMGVFEMDAYSRGTFAVAHAVAHAYALTIVGGGDTALAVHRAGESENISFISTGGGAALQLLEGKPLPGLAALTDDKE